MLIGYDAKRAYCNNTGLGNYSRMVIGGVARVLLRRNDGTDGVVLYTPKMHEEYVGYFSSEANISTRQPAGWRGKFPALWRTFGEGKWLTFDKIDLFHGLSHELPYNIPEKVKKVVTMHDLIVLRHPEYYNAIDRSIYRWKQRHACEVADIVVAISEQTKADLMEMMQVPEEKIRVVYQSCDPLFWRFISDPLTVDDIDVHEEYLLPKRYFVAVGTVEERKNQGAAIQALAKLPGDVGLAIVGRPRGGYSATLRQLAKECGVENRVFFFEDIPFDYFPAMYNHAAGSLYVSRFEGFGIPILESMCCDTPVITSNLSSMPEAGGDAALYVAPDDVEALATQMRRLLEDESLRQECIKKGRIQRERFAPEKVSRDMVAVYDELLS